MIKKSTTFKIALSLLFTSILVVSIKNYSSKHDYVKADMIALSPLSASVIESVEPLVKIGNNKIPVELAITTQAINKGLSGRPSLPDDSGMLFMFSKAGKYRFWMPDMHFSLDMIWINDGKVVDISHDVTNIFDLSKPVYYKPKSPAQYIIEVNAGYCVKHGISIGDKVSFQNIPNAK